MEYVKKKNVINQIARQSLRHCLYIFCLLALASCYKKTPTAVYAGQDLADGGASPASFSREHHYDKNYNFVVDADSVVLLSQQPEEMISDLPTDTFAISKNERIVVADIRIIPTDTIDSVWVEVADGKASFGWAHEKDLLEKVVPDDPMSQFISFFSNTHLLLFLVFLVFISFVYMVVKLRKKNVPFVHLRDIDSFYPALLCIIAALSATLYASIQMFAAEEWQDFYYHPTLNPFSVPLVLSLFLTCVWAFIIIAIAVVEDVFRLLSVGNALLYLGGTMAVCAVNYIVFSLTTLYYAGYLLFAVYLCFALYRYFRFTYKPLVCGRCGARLRRKGRCPCCGALNE